MLLYAHAYCHQQYVNNNRKAAAETGISSLTKKMALEAFKYKRGELLVLDQVKLPHCHEYIEVKTTEDGWQVINKMQVKIIFPDLYFLISPTS